MVRISKLTEEIWTKNRQIIAIEKKERKKENENIFDLVAHNEQVFHPF